MQEQKWRTGTQACRLSRWKDFQNQLVWCLRLLDRRSNSYVTISWTKTNRFVQFASMDKLGILGEATGNHYLSADNKIPPESCRLLVKLGWGRPDTSDPGNTSESIHRYFRREWLTPVPFGEIALLASRTLREVFGIRSTTELKIRRASFAPAQPYPAVQRSQGRPPRLKRTKNIYEFFVRYPCGLAAVGGYRRAARHFGLHSVEDPGSVGNDDYRLLIHKSADVLRDAVKRISAAYSTCGEPLREESIDAAEDWLGNDSGVHWFHHDWKHWYPEQDEGALESLGWERTLVEYEKYYRVTLRKIKPPGTVKG